MINERDVEHSLNEMSYPFKNITMISPFTGGNATLHHEVATITFRREEYSYIHSYYECDDTHIQFSVEGMDDANIAQVYNQYRVKHGVPFADEIKAIREGYGVSAAKMSAILGFGDNQYRLYEAGEMPSLSNGRLLSAVKNTAFFKQILDSTKEQLGSKDYESILANVNRKEVELGRSDMINALVYDNRKRCVDNGYSAMDANKLKNIILFFIQRCSGAFNTKMNKLLFYLDMVAYRESGYGMTGLAYKAIQFGPVPVRWDRVYSMIDGINQEIVNFDSGAQGVVLTSTEEADLSMFSDREIRWMNDVVDRFGSMTSSCISEISHSEDAWIKASQRGSLVDYQDAFSIKAI